MVGCGFMLHKPVLPVVWGIVRVVSSRRLPHDACPNPDACCFFSFLYPFVQEVVSSTHLTIYWFGEEQNILYRLPLVCFVVSGLSWSTPP